MKNYRKVLRQLKGKGRKQRSIQDLEQIVDSVVSQDRLEVPAEEILQKYDSPLPYTPARDPEEELPKSDEVVKSYEELTGLAAFELREYNETLKVDRSLNFPGMRGFHSTFDHTERYQLRLIVEKM